jgi:hypothetical protein
LPSTAATSPNERFHLRSQALRAIVDAERAFCPSIRSDKYADPAAAILSAWLRDRHRAVLFDFNGTLSHDEDLLFQIYLDLTMTELDYTLTPKFYREMLVTWAEPTAS